MTLAAKVVADARGQAWDEAFDRLSLGLPDDQLQGLDRLLDLRHGADVSTWSRWDWVTGTEEARYSGHDGRHIARVSLTTGKAIGVPHSLRMDLFNASQTTRTANVPVEDLSLNNSKVDANSFGAKHKKWLVNNWAFDPA